MRPPLAARASAALLVLAAVAPAGPRDADTIARTAHARALRAERTAALLRAWLEAGADARARAVAALGEAHPRGAPLGAAPTLPALDAARRALEGPSSGDAPPADEEEPRLRALVDALDVRAVPGAFAPATPDAGGLGAPITVRIAPLWNVQAPREVVVTLTWTGPDGATLHAREEPVGGRAFTARGFEMYVRAPPSPPGLWHLALEARAGGATARAVPLPVPCTSPPPAPDAVDPRGPGDPRERREPVDRDERREPMDPGEPAPPADDAAAVRALLAARWEALLEAGSRTAVPAGSAIPRGVLRADERTVDGVWTLRDDPAPRCAVVLLAPPEESTGAVLLEPLGSRWRHAGDELGARVLSARMPYPVTDLAAFLRELPGLDDLADDVPVFLVARGMSSSHISPALAGDLPPGLAGAVLTASAPKHLPRAPDFELLLVGLAAEADRAPADAARVPGEPFPLLDEPDLPERVRDWLLSLRGALPDQPAPDDPPGSSGPPADPPDDPETPDPPERDTAANPAGLRPAEPGPAARELRASSPCSGAPAARRFLLELRAARRC